MPRFETFRTGPSDPLEKFSLEEQRVIKEKVQVLSSLVYLIGKDYRTEVEINPEPGWHWDFEKNVVRADPQDLLTKPIEFLRFVMSHEAGHRRISRGFEVVPREVWEQPGFGFMLNSIEDPRDNNFVADTVPHFREEMAFAYGAESETEQFEASMKKSAQDKFGTQPRFMQAGFEYMRLWYQISLGKEPIVSEDLPDDVRDVVMKTLPAVRRSWNTYPSRKEAEEGTVINGKKLTGEETITEYARASFKINHQIVWPLFKTLVDRDIEDQKSKKSDQGSGKEKGDVSEDSKEKDFTEVSENEESPDSSEEAELLIKEFAEELAKHFEGESEKAKERSVSMTEAGTSSSDNNSGEEDKDVYQGEVLKQDIESKESKPKKEPTQEIKKSPTLEMSDEKIQELIKALETREKTDPQYMEVLKEHAVLIDQLTFELQEIFNKRRHTRWQPGYKSGKKIHIGRAIQEEVRGSSPFETGVFMRREQPKETDYVINLLVDLSGSMNMSDKIIEAYKATVVLSEVLNNIGVKFSVTGFNTRLHNFKTYVSELDDTIRQKYQEMLYEVSRLSAGGTDDGWALDTVRQRVLAQEETQKIIFVVSDGVSAPSEEHRNYDLGEVVKSTLQSRVKLVGLGLGDNTGHVEKYYPNSVANIKVTDLAKVLAQKVREAIEQT